MDVYHQVLHRLNEMTGGKDSKAVDFKDLVKKLGFYGNYTDIFERLSREGWISETPKADFVSITHWGVMENRKSSSGVVDSNVDLQREVNKTLAAAKEFSLSLESLPGNISKEDFKHVEKKFEDLKSLVTKVKGLLK